MLVKIGHNNQPLCLHASHVAKPGPVGPPPFITLPGTLNNSSCRTSCKSHLDSTPITMHIYRHGPYAVGMGCPRHECHTMLGGEAMLLQPPVPESCSHPKINK
jgi:hypothetical protein